MKELGIEPMLLLAQIVNFGIIFLVLKKFLYKPILTMLDKRKKEIEEGLQAAKKAQLGEEEAKEKQEKLVAEAKKEARTILEEAKKHAEEQKKGIIAEAHKEASTVLAKAKVQADAKVKAVEQEMRVQAVDLAALMAQKLLPEVLSDADHKKVIASQLKALEKQLHRYTNMNARVLSSQPLSKEERQSLEAILKSRFENLSYDYSVDPELLAGLRVEVGDWVFDSTAARDLRQMVQTLKN